MMIFVRLLKSKIIKIRNYQPKHFSFNVEGGRCETCKGEGEVTIEMQFMADVHLECETCKGKRFKKEVLEVNLMDKSIDDILNLTIDDAIAFFQKTEQLKLQKITTFTRCWFRLCNFRAIFFYTFWW